MQSIIEMLDSNSGDFSLIHQVKDFLFQHLKFKFSIENSALTDNQLCLITTLNKSELQTLQSYLPTIEKSLDYEILTLESGSKQVVIKAVNTSLIEKNKNEIDKFVEENLEKQFQSFGIADKEVITTATPLQQKKLDLDDLGLIAKLIQTSYNIDAIHYKDGPLRQKVLNNFNKYKNIADLFLMEYICRGSFEDLNTLTKLECKVDVKRVTNKYTDFLVAESSNKKMKIVTEEYTYLIRANFDTYLFAKYLNEKKELTPNAKFLGAKEEVKKCIEHVCGQDSSKAKALVTYLDKLNAYQFDVEVGFNIK